MCLTQRWPVIERKGKEAMEVKRKKQKQFIKIAGNPKYDKSKTGTPVVGVVRPRPAQEIVNPLTGTVDWGQFPETDVKTRVFPAGPIRLRYGEHKGPNNGYGLAHIWEAHFKSDEHGTPMLGLVAVANFMAGILMPGAQIFYEFGNGRAGAKNTIFKSKKGIVIVEERQDGQGNTFYSIVTAFPGRNAHGQLVGTI